MDKIQLSISDLLASLANAQDLVSTKLSNHHQQVAYLTFRLSEHIKLFEEEQKDAFLAGLIHDIGALSTKEKLELIESEAINANHHGFRGAKLLEGFKPLDRAAEIIKYHHLAWNNGEGRSFLGESVPFESHIIHLADRTCALINPGRNIFSQLPNILQSIRQRANTVFAPELVDALFELGKKEFIWLDLVSKYPAKMINSVNVSSIVTLEIDDIVDLAQVFSRIIDFRSPFTANHSVGVAKTAEKLAQLMGFSPYECKMMLVAGYLHDLGKIAISDDVLEKPAKLNNDEFNEMRAHTYYTYRLLAPLEELKIINVWASFHHEKLNGKGYPFHISGDSLTTGSRIMAVADVFTAISENRPYRKGMDFNGVKRVLEQMVDNNDIDGKVVKVLLDNYQEINSIREKSQLEADQRYEAFLSK